MPLPKPTSKPNWTDGNPSFGSVTIEPSSGKKLNGWSASERPAFQFMNWLFWIVGEWIKYFESVTDELAGNVVAYQPVQEVPAGTVNGTNDTFTLTADPISQDALRLFVNSRLVPKTDFTLLGNTITFAPSAIPEVGNDLYADYMVQVPFNGGPPVAPSGVTPITQLITLTGPQIAAKQVVLAYPPVNPINSDVLLVDDGNQAVYSLDYTIAANVFSWAGLGMDDGSLVAGDKIKIRYFI